MRYYDPEAGRFISRDPLGMWGDPGQRGNAQNYCGNNPVNRVDPLGLSGAALLEATAATGQAVRATAAAALQLTAAEAALAIAFRLVAVTGSALIAGRQLLKMLDEVKALKKALADARAAEAMAFKALARAKAAQAAKAAAAAKAARARVATPPKTLTKTKKQRKKKKKKSYIDVYFTRAQEGGPHIAVDVLHGDSGLRFFTHQVITGNPPTGTPQPDAPPSAWYGAPTSIKLVGGFRSTAIHRYRFDVTDTQALDALFYQAVALGAPSREYWIDYKCGTHVSRVFQAAYPPPFPTFHTVEEWVNYAKTYGRRLKGPPLK